jgi:hypothetical protein
METYKLVNGKIITEIELGDKTPIVKSIKAEIEELKGKKTIASAKVDDIQARIDVLKAFLQSIGE